MRLFGRGKSDEPEPSFTEVAKPSYLLAVPDGAYVLPESVQINDDGVPVRFITGRVQAKEVAAALKLTKKKLQLEKKQVTAEMTEIRADYRLSNSQRSRTRGSGSLARTFRTFEGMSRDSARRNQGNALAPLENEKASIDEQIHVIDRVLLEIEAFVLGLPEEPKPIRTRSRRACAFCGETAKATDKFCSSCGEALS